MIKYIKMIIYKFNKKNPPCDELLKIFNKKILEVDDTLEQLNIQFGNQNSNSQVHVNENSGIIYIHNYNKVDIKLCKVVSKLTKKRKEYYYHLIKADLLKSKY